MIKSLKYLFVSMILPTIIFATSNSLEKVSLQLNWKHQFEFAGFYIAKENGFYKDVGLDVEILEWNPNINNITDTLNDTSTYTMNYSSILIDISNGKDIVLLSAIFQSSPLVLLTTEESNIQSIKDFKGKRIMSSGDLTNNASFISMMHSKGVVVEDIIMQKPSFNVQDLIDKKTDLIASFISNEPFVLKELGAKPVIFNPKNYGFDFYDNILATSNENIKKNPLQVKQFTQASLKGWKYAFSNIEETVQLILDKYNTQNKSREALLYEANALKELAYFGTSKIGKIEKRRLAKSYQVYKLLGLATHNLDFEKLIYNGSLLDFKLTYDEKKYLKNKKAITMCIDPDWMPFEMFDKNKKHVGITADYFKLLEKSLDITINVVETLNWEQSIEFAKNRKCDILSLAMRTANRDTYLNFTESYLEIPIVLATKMDVPFIDDYSSLKDKKIGIPKGYAFIELFKKEYPYLHIVEVNNVDEGLQKVTQNELYGFIGTLATVGYKLQTKYIGELKITSKFDNNMEGGIAVRNDDKVMLNIFQKAIQNIDINQRQDILNNWISIKYERGTDYTLVLYILLVVFIMFLFFFYRQYILHKTNKELQLLASTDSLTKLYNRRYFITTAEYIFLIAKREKKAISVIMLDIDFFKKVNDIYGHKIGDDVIIKLSSILLNSTRKSDIVCRWGGEEFLILLSDTDINGATVIAEKIRKIVNTTTIKVDDHLEVTFTVSFGVDEVNISDIDIEPSIKRADEALYKAKKTGRNKVCIS
ncbi:MAG: polar amino acid transport system substrate-binding protein [Sulfurimonas sp.]|jgi:polar amino acid transport system substrate-binding protein|uniref:diguanylate cyclase n=1 Tax=Sulfurimonas sp. TaxID=2022749 RepID=UPI0039E5A9A1